MDWYLVYTKPRQEKRALQNLEQQGYQCYLPMLKSECLRNYALTVREEPLFPRYLFIRLGLGSYAKSWAPIRSTKGVSRLVNFGVGPVRVDDCLIEVLRTQEALVQAKPKPFVKSGELVMLTDGPFAGLEAIYQMADGNERVIVLIELMNQLISVKVTPASLQRIS